MNTNLDLIELQPLILKLSENDRWFLLKWLIELLQPQLQTSLRHPEIENSYPDTSFYGCIQDDTFFRHFQENQAERESIE